MRSEEWSGSAARDTVPASAPRPGADSDCGRQSGRLAQWLDPDRALFAGAGCFAVWTVLCHATVLLGGSLDQLIAATAATALVAAAIRWLIIRPQPSPPAPCDEPAGRPPATSLPVWLTAAFTAAGIAVPLLVTTQRPLAAWFTAALATAAAAVTLALRGDRDLRPPAPATPLVWIVAAAMALVAAVANRPDVDDALYLNLAVGAVDNPAAPLLAVDHMHGVDGVPLDPATYRFYTLEPALAAATRLTGIAPITWAHLVLPPIAAILMVLAWARLIRLLAPTRWRAVLLAQLATLVVVGNTHAWYGNVGLVRLHQGKCLFASVAVPLLLAAAADLGRRPDRQRLRRLAAAVLAAVGLTGSALWLAPVLVAIGLIAGGPAWRRDGRSVLAAAAIASYPVLLGLAIVASAHLPGSGLAVRVMGPAAATVTAPSAAAAPWPVRGGSAGWRLAPMQFALSYVLGEGALPAVVVLVVLGLWWLSPEARARRLAVASALTFVLVFFNPFLSLWLSDHVTGRSTYWRGFWLLPVPLLLALVTTAPTVRLRRHGRSAAVAVTALVLVVVTRVPLLGADNQVRLAPFDLKVPTLEYAVARRVVAAAPAGAAVITPPDVAAWITTFRHHPCPLKVRQTFFSMLERAVDRDDARRRDWATRAVVSKRLGPEVLAAFADALTRYQVAAVVLPAGNPNLPTLRATLDRAGYRPLTATTHYQLWQRPQREASAGGP